MQIAARSSSFRCYFFNSLRQLAFVRLRNLVWCPQTNQILFLTPICFQCYIRKNCKMPLPETNKRKKKTKLGGTDQGTTSDFYGHFSTANKVVAVKIPRNQNGLSTIEWFIYHTTTGLELGFFLIGKSFQIAAYTVVTRNIRPWQYFSDTRIFAGGTVSFQQIHYINKAHQSLSITI